MKHAWDEIWPVPEASNGFALRVLQASARAPVKPTRWKTVLLAALLSGSLITTLVVSVSFDRHQKEAAKRAAILQAENREATERLRRLQAEFEQANRREQELQASLTNAKDDATRAKLEAELEGQKKTTAAARGNLAGRVLPSGIRSAIGADKPAKKSNCGPGDPLCD